MSPPSCVQRAKCVSAVPRCCAPRGRANDCAAASSADSDTLLARSPAGGHMKSRSLISLCGAALLATACSQTDAGITTSVKSQLVSDDTVKARQIDVTTRDHVVTLTGDVNTAQEEERALQIARSTTGVRDVVDRLRSEE